MPATSPLILVRLHGEYGTNQGKAYEAPTICREYEPLTAVIRLSVSVGLFFCFKGKDGIRHILLTFLVTNQMIQFQFAIVERTMQLD